MKVNIRAPFCTTSYGLASLNIVKSLTELGHEVSCFPIGGIDGNDMPLQFHDSLRQSLANAQYWDVDAPSVCIYHQFALAENVGRKRIGFPIFELDTFNELELHHLRSLDQILVCSSWGKEICYQNGLTQSIDVIPLGVDLNIFFPKENVDRFVQTYDNKNSSSFTPMYIKEQIAQNTTVFISVAKKELRKYHDGLIKCFEKAFSKEDNCELWMVWGNRILQYKKPEEDKQWTEYYQKTRLPGKIRLFEWLPRQEDVVDLMSKADCFVGVSRAEGWNLGLLEAMSMGLKVITNDYSGHTEFVSENNSYLVPFREKESAVDGVWFFGAGNWMSIEKPEEDLIVSYMRKVHYDKQNGSSMLNSAGIETARRFSWKNTANALISAVS